MMYQLVWQSFQEHFYSWFSRYLWLLKTTNILNETTHRRLKWPTDCNSHNKISLRTTIHYNLHSTSSKKKHSQQVRLQQMHSTSSKQKTSTSWNTIILHNLLLQNKKLQQLSQQVRNQQMHSTFSKQNISSIINKKQVE